MQVIKYPERETWSSLLTRPTFDTTSLFDTVQKILDEIRMRGDAAVKEYTEKFDKVQLEILEVTKEEMAEADNLVSVNLKQAIEMARRNIWKFHSEQQRDYPEIQTSPGVYLLAKSHCHRKSRTICSWRHSTFIFYSFNVGNSCTNSRM